jgi:hypothetical protein
MASDMALEMAIQYFSKTWQLSAARGSMTLDTMKGYCLVEVMLLGLEITIQS